MRYSEEKEILRKIADIAFWDTMKREIFEYVKKYLICQLKGKTRKIGLREIIDRPQEVWKQISMNHITKLPKSKEKDSILIIQDQLSEMIHPKAVFEKQKAKKVWQDY